MVGGSRCADMEREQGLVLVWLRKKEGGGTEWSSRVELERVKGLNG